MAIPAFVIEVRDPAQCVKRMRLYMRRDARKMPQFGTSIPQLSVRRTPWQSLAARSAVECIALFGGITRHVAAA